MSDNEEELPPIIPQKAYKSMDFINSQEARTIRVMCEFEETLQRLRTQGVKETILFFGSAKALSTKQFAKAMKTQTDIINSKESTQEQKEKANQEIESLKKREWLCDVYDRVGELSKKLTEWALKYRSSTIVGGGYLFTGQAEHEEANMEIEGEEEEERPSVILDSSDPLAGPSPNTWAVSDVQEPSKKKQKKNQPQSLLICTGGGRGLMEAANKGAAQVPGAKSIGMGISLPFSQGVNPYVTPELGFEFHYFFTRKYWMIYPCRGLVVPPGGFATLDALFELLTLKQTGKIKVDIPVVMFGKTYWQKLINFPALVKFGTIAQKDFDSLYFTDDVSDAFEYITKRVTELRDSSQASSKISH